ncbi:TrwJ4 protein precursor [Bartonella tribocorum CIP 105476]|uniref:TrwJ4 protein n=2 Tax=Bartonella tribocorum TaxID=85701 RepID=A9IZ57_BART1|nr:type IV secretion system protein [Bartonella tribocorum]CAK02490.1 TrwJ4 protein precursor [Bartonella tribocorum CIP 105476]
MLGFLIVKKSNIKMKKRFIIIGMITLLGMINLTLTSNLSWSSGAQGSTVQIASSTEYLKIIELLKEKIKVTEEQIDNAKKVYQSIKGSRVTELRIKGGGDFFLHDMPVYAELKDYHNKNMDHYPNIKDIAYSVYREEQRANFWSFSPNKMREIINKRLQYSGIVSKAVSLQTFKDAENRFTQIINFLNEIDRTMNLAEVFELQTRIRNMSSMLQNEYAKLQMVRNLRDNEELLIDIQKRKLYGKIISYQLTSMPRVRL